MDLGKDVGLTLMRDNTYANVDNWLPTGIPQYDAIMGGGIPFGRVTEVFGKKQVVNRLLPYNYPKSK
ncbi:hypothetical protein Alsa1_CDS0066 [Staphylococcus phage Alsa_1]|nr:hypothetical protein Alsa1_CDS0066 [Staphylococcus phage Alsa_1]